MHLPSCCSAVICAFLVVLLWLRFDWTLLCTRRSGYEDKGRARGCARARWRIRAAASPSLCGMSWVASSSPGTSSASREGTNLPPVCVVLLDLRRFKPCVAIGLSTQWSKMLSILQDSINNNDVTGNSVQRISEYELRLMTWCVMYRYVILTWEMFVCLARYASMWKGCLTLYTGRGGDLQKIGEWVLNIASQYIMLQ